MLLLLFTFKDVHLKGFETKANNRVLRFIFTLINGSNLTANGITLLARKEKQSRMMGSGLLGAKMKWAISCERWPSWIWYSTRRFELSSDVKKKKSMRSSWKISSILRKIFIQCYIEFRSVQFNKFVAHNENIVRWLIWFVFLHLLQLNGWNGPRWFGFVRG